MKHARFNSDPNWPQAHCSHMRTNEKETRLTTSARGSYRLSSLAYRPKKLESESEVAQSCPTLCHPVDCSPPGFSLQGLLQARILEWVVISFSRGSSQPRDQTWVSHITGTRFNLWPTRDWNLPLKTENPLKSFKWLRTMVVDCCVSDFINNRTVAKSEPRSVEATPNSTQDSAQEEQIPQSPWPFSPGPEMIGPTPGCITFCQNQPDLSSCRSQSKKNKNACACQPWDLGHCSSHCIPVAITDP